MQLLNMVSVEIRNRRTLQGSVPPNAPKVSKVKVWISTDASIASSAGKLGAKTNFPPPGPVFMMEFMFGDSFKTVRRRESSRACFQTPLRRAIRAASNVATRKTIVGIRQ